MGHFPVSKTLQILGCLLLDCIFYFPGKLELFKYEKIQYPKSIQPGSPQEREGSQLCLCCSRNESTAHRDLLKAWPTGSAATNRGFCSWESSPGTGTSLPCPEGQAFLGCLSLSHPDFLSHFLSKQNLLLSTSLCLRAESLEARFFFLLISLQECPLSFLSSLQISRWDCFVLI